MQAFFWNFREDEERAYKLGLIHIDRCLRQHGSMFLEAGLYIIEDDPTELDCENFNTASHLLFDEEWELQLSFDQSTGLL